MFLKIKKGIQRWLNAIADQNKQSFGNQKLDCCDLNKPRKKD
jgi:hypothetical protein